MPYSTQSILRDQAGSPIPQEWDEAAGVFRPLAGDAVGLAVQLPPGAATQTTLASRLSESDFDAKAGSLTETAPTTDTASSGLNGRLQRIAQRLTSLIALLPSSIGLKADAASLSVGLSTEQRAILAAQATEATLVAASAKLPASLGLKADAASLSVGLSTEQRAILVAHLTEADFDAKAGSLTETAPATDTASSGLNGRLQRVAQRLTTLIAQLPASLGVKADAASLSVALSTEQRAILVAQLSEADFDAKAGSLTETAPASDTASSGLNGRLQRVAQRLTSLLSLLPASIGQKNMAGSLSVVVASDNIPHVVVDSGGAVTTEYTEAAVDTTITGTAIMWEDTSDTLRAVSAAKPLPIRIESVATSVGSTEYTEGDVDTTITGPAILWEDVGDVLTTVKASKPLPVDTEMPAAVALGDSDGNPTAPTIGASLMGWTTSAWQRVRTTLSGTDGMSNGILCVGGYLFNGAAWDQPRGNIAAQLLASLARTTTQTSADIVNYNGSLLSVILNMTVVGTGSVTVSIQGKSATGVYYTILTGAAVVTNVTNVYAVGPGLPATTNVSANAQVPRTFRVVVTANNANSATYSLDYALGL